MQCISDSYQIDNTFFDTLNLKCSDLSTYSITEVKVVRKKEFIEEEMVPERFGRFLRALQEFVYFLMFMLGIAPPEPPFFHNNPRIREINQQRAEMAKEPLHNMVQREIDSQIRRRAAAMRNQPCQMITRCLARIMMILAASLIITFIICHIIYPN